MADKNKLEIHPKPQQPIQVNRPLIMTIIIAVVAVLLLAIISAFNTTKYIKTTSTPTKITTDKPLTVSSELKGLPENYSDVDTIRKFLPESPNHELASLTQQFDELKNAYLLLKQQLLGRKDLTPEKIAEDPRIQQAKNSSLVFSNLGSDVDSMVGGSGAGAGGGLQTDRSYRPYSPLSGNQQVDVPPTPEQEKFFKKQNEDNLKLAVMKAKVNPEEVYNLPAATIKPVSKHEVLAGTMIPATLITGINTTVPGSIVAQVRQNIFDTVTGKYLLIPKGSKLVGEYDSRVIAGQSRVLIVLNRIIRPDGSSVLLGKFIGADLHGISGMEGNVDNHWGQVLGAAAISTILSVGAGVASDSHNSSNTQYRSSGQNAFLGGAQGIAGIGQNISNRALNMPPTITLPSGYQFNVVVKKDIVITPYSSKT